MVSLFTTRRNYKLPIYVFQFQIQWYGKNYAFWHLLDHINSTLFFPFALFCQVISQAMLSCGPAKDLVAPLWSHQKWFPDLLSMLVAEPLRLPSGMKFFGSAVCRKVPSGIGYN